MNITLKSLHIENFKGIANKDITFSDKTVIKGANASGKTTVVDAFLWLMFDKNSQYATDFEIRTLDSNGNPIHMTDITVSAVIDFDGTEHELKKVQRENWVKQRGTETAVFKGNVNSFEIDGYPKSLAEYKSFVESVVSEDKFKIITNPNFFPNMKWKDQRELLMKFATTDKDVDLAIKLGGYDEILDELSKAPSTDDILKKFKVSKKTLENKLDELPVRIDEITKSKVDYDLAELELAKHDLELKLEQAKASTENGIDALKKELMEVQFAKSALANKLNMELNSKRYELKNKVTELNSKFELTTNELKSFENGIETVKKLMETDSETMRRMGDDYYAKQNEQFDESKWVYDPNSENCSMCGQKLPADKIESIRSDFEKRKAKAKESFETLKKLEMQTLVDRGNALKVQIEEHKKNIAERESKIVEYKVALESLVTERTTVENELSKMPVEVNLLDDKEYALLVEQENALNVNIAKAESETKANAIDTTSIESELFEINSKLSQAINNCKIDERIEELRNEQKDVSQKIANCEKIIFLTEQFVKTKLETISVAINSKFSFVKYKLFDVAINGGVSECCELTVNGVPYSSLNSAGKIQAGLDIINTFSETYGVVAPVFLDNRESCTWIPETKSQIISLYVDPSNKTLLIESEC